MLSFFSAKGGVGCSLVTAAAAVLSARSRPTLLVDLAGDLVHLLGVAAAVPAGPGPGAWTFPGSAAHPLGLAEWFEAVEPLPDALSYLEVPIGDRLRLLPFGSSRLRPTTERIEELTGVLAADERQVLIDVGTNAHLVPSLLAASARSLLVTRACYLALRRAVGGPRPDGVVLVEEPGRALTRGDVSAAVGAPIVASIPWLPAIARTVDAGLLASRVPTPLGRLAPLSDAEAAS